MPLPMPSSRLQPPHEEDMSGQTSSLLIKEAALLIKEAALLIKEGALLIKEGALLLKEGLLLRNVFFSSPPRRRKITNGNNEM